MNKSATFLIPELNPRSRVKLILNNLGTRTAQVQMELPSGYVDLPDAGSLSTGDTFSITMEVPPALPNATLSNLQVVLTAGAAEVVEAQWQEIPHN
tara:strand:- start:37711 stop:37998 length:288 start_codon:yes stop_codon:yes gene_type:complete